MNKLQILNAEASLAMNLDGFKLVEASAGTGKTYAIGNLYLRMLFEAHLVSQILVVTFTNAATEELRGRIRLRIHQALKHLDDPFADDNFLNTWSDSLSGDHERIEHVRRQLKLALNSMDEAAIYTIHGFCQRALTEYAFNSRQAFDVEMISDDNQIWHAAIKDWWRSQAYPLHKMDLSLFSLALGNVDKLIELQRPLRNPRVKLLPDISNTLGQLFSSWHDLEAQCLQLATMWNQDKEQLASILYSDALTRRKKIYKLDQLPALIEALDDYFASENPLGFPEQLSAVRASALCSILKKGKEEEGLEHQFFTTVDEILDRADSVKQQFRIRALSDAHDYAAEQVAHTKQQAGQLSFDDQLVLLEQALADNKELGIQIHHRFPVAMIDEFQDTDAIQYDIFKHIYHHREQGGLIMIGDPKQAIYSFRGGDIFTYIRAKDDASQLYTLDTNWRSTPRLIHAVNQLFSHRHDPFIYAAIPFAPVNHAPKSHALLCEEGEEVIPLTVWHIPLNEKNKPMAKNVALPLMHAHTANEIAKLIQAGRDKRLKLGEEPVKPGDIAVLVRNHFEAADLREALRQRGVSAVATGNEQVFDAQEAEGLKLILAAVIDFRDAGLLRQAMASALLDYHYQDIHACFKDESQWLAWAAHFQHLHDAWSKKGFMAMFQLMLRRLNVGERLACHHNASRRLTNLLHLGELLQQASQSITGMDALYHWFEQQMNEASSEAELRLESDGDLVRIATIHSSKGLEYPIVFLPYMWSCKPREPGKGLLPFFDEKHHQHSLDAGADAGYFLLAEKERLAEDVRLAYVALTRACAKIYVAWGHTANAGKTAMGWLLHEVQQPLDLDQQSPEVFGKGMSVDKDLEVLAASENIEICSLTDEIPEKISVSKESDMISGCKVSEFSAAIALDWRISSFSSMTRDVHQIFSQNVRLESDDPVFQFPAGSQTGLFLHALLEELDFQQDTSASVEEFTGREAIRYGLNPDQAPVVQAWIEDLLATNLDSSGLTLRQIGEQRRLNELDFDFSVNRIDISLLNERLDKVAGRSLQPLRIDDCRGFINGVIDLVFEHDGRYYLADYKSNHLGFSLDAYAPEQLRQAVFDRRYDLQYLIYSLALHRYLKLRLSGYDYDRHFGGAYYLFLRGMRPEHGNNYGVHFDRPDKALIEMLDFEIFNAEVIS